MGAAFFNHVLLVLVVTAGGPILGWHTTVSRSRSEVVTQKRPSAARPAAGAAADVLNELKALTGAYNKRSFIVASRYISDAVIDQCGGPTKYAVASRANFDMEQVVYTVERVEVTKAGADRIDADVYFSSEDVATRKPVDIHQGVGLTFVRSTRRDIPWVLTHAFPIGIKGLCR